MNRNHLAAFGVVCEAGSFSRAAERMLVSQPAVSLQVGELEKAVGVQLLDRLPRGIRPTAAGRLLAGYAKRIAALEAEADHALREMLGLVRGRLTVGASLTVGSYVAPGLLADFRAGHPGIDLSLEVANTHDVQARVLAGEIEVGLTEGFVEDDRLSAVVFAHDQLILVVNPQHPLARRKSVPASALSKYELVLREVGSGTRAVVERALRSVGPMPAVAMSLGNSEAVKVAIARGIGVGFVSKLAVTTELSAGTLVQVNVPDLKLRRELHAITLRGQTLSPASAAFWEQITRWPRP